MVPVLRTGLLGRRYIGRNGWFSMFAKGDISLLVGDMDIRTDTTDNLGGMPVICSFAQQLGSPCDSGHRNRSGWFAGSHQQCSA